MELRRDMGLKKRVHAILDPAGGEGAASRVFGIFIVTLISLNIVALALETVKSVRDLCPGFFLAFEVVSVLIFTAEYLLRLWSCTAMREYSSPIGGRLRFAVSPLALIDLLAVLPFYLPFLGIDLRFVRAVRLMRLFRVAKLGRYSQAVRTLGKVFVAKKEELGVTLSVLLILLLISSCLMYIAEHDAQPEAFSSIPAAMWWSVTTLTTVGYGDIYPVTIWGKALAAVVAILGIGVFALPTGIIGAGFVEEMQARKKRPSVRTCPHCGGHLSD